MRYAKIDSFEVVNGINNGVSLFVQGCHFRCPNCFNSEAWDFNSGVKWTPDVKQKLIELAKRPYIKRISILGGEPLADENLKDVYNLVDEIRLSLPEKTIWLYSGYTWDECHCLLRGIDEYCTNFNNNNRLRMKIIEKCDVMVDGRYVDSLRDLTLKFRGSKNQRVINIKESLKHNKVILWCD